MSFDNLFTVRSISFNKQLLYHLRFVSTLSSIVLSTYPYAVKLFLPIDFEVTFGDKVILQDYSNTSMHLNVTTLAALQRLYKTDHEYSSSILSQFKIIIS